MKSRFSLMALVFAALAVACPLEAEAIYRQVRLPMAGCRGFLHAKGSVTFTDVQAEKGIPDGQTFLLQVDNVPLPPGTELLVYIDGDEYATITLDKKRSAMLQVKSSFSTQAPVIKPSSYVVLRLIDGTNVMW